MAKISRKEIFSIPNLMGYFRILMIPVFSWMYLTASTREDVYRAAAVVFISSVTDLLDGWVARRFHMVTELGKFVDPLADKLTHGALALCLAFKYPLMWALAALLAVKEGYMAVMGLILLKRGKKLDGAMWFGKVCTALLFVGMLVLFLWYGMPEAAANGLTPVLKTLHQIPTQLQQMALEREKTIRLNVLAASTLVTQALISYKKDHDGLHFRLIQNSQCEDADITVFTRENFQIPTDTKERYELFKERIFLAVPHNSPYASEESVRLQDFAHEDFISLSGSRSIRTICDRYCMQAGFVPHIIYESDSPDTVKNLIASGLGVGFWPHYTWGMDSMEQIRLLPIAEPTCQRAIILQLHRHARGQEAVCSFYAFLSRYLRQLKAAEQH